MARPWQHRSFACLTLACGLTAALVAGPAVAGEGTPAPDVPTVDVPADASASTRAAVASAEARLAQLQTEIARTALDYTSAQARLSLARQTVAAAAQQAFVAEQAAAQARVQVGQYAASAYIGGPMAGPAAILNSDDATELMHVAGMLDIVGDSQTGALHRLRQGRADAIAAADRARTARQAAGVAKAEAIAYVAQAKAQMAETVTLLELLQVRADREAKEARAARAARAASLAVARVAALSATGGIGDLPAAATATGPEPGLPEETGPDPGDGEPGGDHLRPRAERALLLVEDLFGITDIGGWRQSDSVSSDHPQGRAIDVMMGTLGALPDPTRVELGWRVARWAQANAAGLGVTYVIWQGRIWSVARSAEGWRDYTVNFPYGTNVTPTTLHMDHVHISFG